MKGKGRIAKLGVFSGKEWDAAGWRDGAQAKGAPQIEDVVSLGCGFKRNARSLTS